MIRTSAIALTVFLVTIVLANAESGEPSDGAKGMAGATGTIELKPDDWKEGETTWWVDSDGVSPGTPGCHLGTDAEGKRNGRMFGEACLPDGRLVESNPKKDGLHSHANDTGHPDTFDCAVWCKGEGAPGGVCKPAEAPPCASSAFCSCTFAAEGA